MKVLGLKVRDFAGVEAFEMSLEGNNGLIRGRNGSGKTSVLNALIYALGGKVDEKIEAPMKRGAVKTRVELDIEGYSVTREVAAGGTPKLVVRRTDNDEKVARPQTFLDSLVPSGLAFRPLDFARYDGKKQRAMLLKATGAEEKLERIQTAYDVAYMHRRDSKRDLSAVQARLEALSSVPNEIPGGGDVSTETLLANLQAVQNKRQRHIEWQRELETATLDYNAATDEVKRIQDMLAAATEKQAAAAQRRAVLKNNEPENPDERVLKQATEALTNADAHNEQCRAWREKQRLQKEVRMHQEQVAQAEKEMERHESEKYALLKGGALIPGLEVKDDGIYVDGVPFGSLNHQQQLEVGIAIAHRQSPKLRCILIDGAESIDIDHWQALLEQAEAAGLQIIATEVSRDGGDLSFEIVES